MRPILALLLLVPLAAAPACKKRGGAKLPPATGASAAPMPQLPAVPSVDPTAGTVAAGDSRTTGTTFAHAEAQVAANGSGTIVEIAVQEDARVKKGDVLFRLDSRDAALRARQAKAALDGANVALKAADADYKRTKAMVEQGAMNKATWDQVEARYEAARVGVEQAKVGLAMAQKALADTVGRSPIDGVVTAKVRNVGDMATMMPPTVVVVVQDQSILDLRVRLPEAALAQVKPGTSLTIRFTSIGVTREAPVTRVLPTVDPRTRTVEVVAELDNADGALKPGLLAEVTVGAHKAAARDGGAR